MGKNSGIHKRADGNWEQKVSLGKDPATGKILRKSVYGKTVEEVKKKVLDLRIEHKLKPPAGETPSITVAQLIDAWLAQQRADNHLREMTVRKYEGVLKVAKASIGELSVASIAQERFTKFFATYNDRPSARKRIFICLRRVFEYGVQQHGLTRNPLMGLKVPVVKRGNKVKHWTAEEARRILDEARRLNDEDPRWHAIYSLALLCGLRRAEILALYWRAIDLEKKTVRVEFAFEADTLEIKSPKTQSSYRTLRMPEECVEALRYLHSRSIQIGLDSLVFGTLRYRWFDSNVHYPLLKSAGVSELNFHSTRHTHASVLLAKGINIKAISARLGHADINITLQTYSHLMPGADEQAAAAMDTL